MEKNFEKEFLLALSKQISPKRRLDLLEWTQKYRVTEKGLRFEFTTRSYLRDIYRCPARQIVIMKGSQLGGTEYAISKVLYFLDYFEGTCIYTFPTESDVRDFVAGRLDASIAKSPYLRERLGNVDSRSIKQFGLGWIYFRGSWSERQALSIPADFLVHDEVDASYPEILEAYSERLSASIWKKRLWLSTPTIPNFGIHKLWEESSQAEWFLRCRGCNWAGLLELEDIDRRLMRLICPRCGKALDRRFGFWVEAYPNRELKGFHLDQLMTATVPLTEILDKRRKYQASRFENHVRGKPFFGGPRLINRAVIMENCFLEGVQKSDAGLHRYMGVDTNDELYIEVSEAFEGRRHIVELLRTSDWDDIKRLIQRHNVKYCVIDLRPEPRLVKALADEFPDQVLYAEYVRIDELFKVDKNDSSRLLVGRTVALDETAEQLRQGKTQLYPLGEDEFVETWIQHWESRRRVEEVGRLGQPRKVWKNSGPDHFAHADVYNYLAFLIGGGHEPSYDTSEGIAEALERPEGFLEKQF